jgi:NAD(P)-dependent dehydrogenase (short-subunit alcohol dehydrogenase family)
MTWSDMMLSGKRVLVTGASSGIGAEIAYAMAEAGANVAIVGRNADRLSRTAERVATTGMAAVKIAADLTAVDAADRVVSEAVDGLGGLDTLVNAAGVYHPSPFESGLASLDLHWATNLRSAYALSAAAVSELRGGGNLLFIGSVGGLKGFAGSSSYGAVKAALHALVRSVAVEEGPNGLRVNAIVPGNIRTSMNESLLADPEFEEARVASTPLRRIGDVQDIAPAAVFLASDAASYITGALLVVDGGLTAG